MPVADLQPPLGFPGGPCQVVDRIVQEVPYPQMQRRLEEAVERGQALPNSSADLLYNDLQVPGFGMPFRQIVLSPHAQYRMDLRGIVVPMVSLALKSYLKQLLDWKAQQSPEYGEVLSNMSRGNTLTWEHPRTGLFVVFRMTGPGTVRVITTYWKGSPDPHAPGVGVCTPRTAYSPLPEDSMGLLVKTQEKFPQDHKPSVLPLPEKDRVPSLGPAQYSKPDSGPAPRTLGVPGEQVPPGDEPARTMPQRRPLSAYTVRLRPVHRQRRQKGQDRIRSRMFYRKNRSQSKTDAKQRYRRLKNNPAFKRQQQIRRQHPERFHRIYASQEEPILFVVGENLDVGIVLGFSEETGLVSAHVREQTREAPLPEFLEGVVFLHEEDVDAMYALLEEAYGEDEEVPSVQEVVAQWLLQKEVPNHGEGTYLNRATDRVPGNEDEPAGAALPDYYVYDNPGSARVIPSGRGFVNKEAVKISEIESRCRADLRANARDVPLRLMRVDAGNSMWHFEARGSKGPYRVRVKALESSAKDVGKVDVLVACTCPFWRWQGSEHWAKTEGYLYGRPVGSAASPVVKDPGHKHGACKHVLAAFYHMTRNRWQVPTKKASRFPPDTFRIWGFHLTGV